MGLAFIIRRGNEPTEEVLRDGEMAYCRNDREFYIGDGKTPMNQLTPFMSLIAGEDNKVHAVRVDKDGNAHAKPVVCYAGNKVFEFKTEK